MAQKNKINPQRIPKTQADVNKAYDLGVDAGMRLLMDVMVYTLGCDMDCDDEWLSFFHDRFMANVDSHLHGELTQRDMRSTAYAEKGWEIDIV